MWIASLYLFTNYQFFLNIFIIFVIFWNFKIILLEKKKESFIFCATSSPPKEQISHICILFIP